MQKGLLYNMLLRLGKYFFLFPLFFIACDDLEDKPSIVPESNGDVFETGTAEMYILSEGLFNQNNSSLARYSFNLNPEKPDVPLNKNDAFQKVQKRHVQEKR